MVSLSQGETGLPITHSSVGLVTTANSPASRGRRDACDELPVVTILARASMLLLCRRDLWDHTGPAIPWMVQTKAVVFCQGAVDNPTRGGGATLFRVAKEGA